VIIEQGDDGHSWYLISSGEVEIVHDGERVRVLGTGDGFGEIALLSDRPRTASVVALGPVDAYRLDRPDFLEAVTGNAHAALAGEELVARRLSELGHPRAGSG
jgi:CRP-like cAMP-binding protein